MSRPAALHKLFPFQQGPSPDAILRQQAFRLYYQHTFNLLAILAFPLLFFFFLPLFRLSGIIFSVATDWGFLLICSTVYYTGCLLHLGLIVTLSEATIRPLFLWASNRGRLSKQDAAIRLFRVRHFFFITSSTRLASLINWPGFFNSDTNKNKEKIRMDEKTLPMSKPWMMRRFPIKRKKICIG